MTEAKTILEESGVFDAEGIDVLIDSLRTHQDVEAIKPVNLKKVISIVIEALENINKYFLLGATQKKLFEQAPPSIKIEQVNEQIQLTFSNPVLEKDIEALNKKLNKIMALNQDDLKALYIQTIRDGEFTEQGGAGLGFIKMSRVSKNQIQFSFSEKNERSSIFTYQVRIDN